MRNPCGSLNYVYSKGYFQWNYVVMDTSNIVLWVSVCERNVNIKDFALTAL